MGTKGHISIIDQKKGETKKEFSVCSSTHQWRSKKSEFFFFCAFFPSIGIYKSPLRFKRVVVVVVVVEVVVEVVVVKISSN